MALTREQQELMLADAEAAYEAGQREDDLAPIDGSTVTMPNLAKSKVVHVRVNDRDHTALTELAEEKGVRVSDVVRSAISRYLRVEAPETSDEIEGLLAALRDRGLRLVQVERAGA